MQVSPQSHARQQTSYFFMKWSLSQTEIGI